MRVYTVYAKYWQGKGYRSPVEFKLRVLATTKRQVTALVREWLGLRRDQALRTTVERDSYRWQEGPKVLDGREMGY